MTGKNQQKNKITSKYLKSLCKKYLPYYKKEGVKVDQNRLFKLAEKEAQIASKIFKKLPELKTCNLFTYVTYWIKETILRDLTYKTLKKVNMNDPNTNRDDFAKAISTYFSILPLDKLKSLRHKIISNSFSYSKRKNALQESETLLKQLEEPFLHLITARNKSACQKGYKQYADLILANSQIPKSTYKHFTKNIDKAIDSIHKQLPKLPNLPRWFYFQVNLPCFICQIPFFPKLTIPKEVIDVVGRKYPILHKFKNKIFVGFGDNARIRYYKEKDSFKITIHKTYNQRHQTIELIHELGHAITMLEDFKKGKDPLPNKRYEVEKSAINIQFNMLKSLSPIIFQAHLGSILNTFHQILFELAVYDNPKQNLSQLYTEIFNRCFPEANQQNNRLYLLNEDIILKPLSSLPHVIAYTKLLLNKYKT